ncbi:MAG TPA: glutathione S-transferase family protein [Candidatus Obscuribacterales bacterium]
MISLYYMPGTCSLAEHIVLEWLGLPYESRKMSREELKSTSYLRLNPSGVVPTLVIDEQVHTENAAIMLYLAGRYPQLWGDSWDEAARTTLTRWLIFITGTLHPHFWPVFAPQRYTTDPAREAQIKVKAAAAALVAKDFRQLEAGLSGRNFLGGQQPSMADAMLFPMLFWGYGLQQPTPVFPNLAGLFRRMLKDPAVQQALGIHELKIPELSAAS